MFTEAGFSNDPTKGDVFYAMKGVCQGSVTINKDTFANSENASMSTVAATRVNPRGAKSGICV